MLRTTLQAAADQATAGHNALRSEFQHDITGLRTEIQNTLGDALTRINAKVTDIDQAQQRLESAGSSLLEKMDKQQAVYMTNLQQVVANAQSEFGNTRNSIDEVVSTVKMTQSTFENMVNGVREEINTLKAQVSSLASTGGGGIFGAAPDGQVKVELDAIKADILLLKSNPGGGTFGAAPGVGGGKLGGFIQ